MIELISIDRCTTCDICVRICPMNVFEAVADSPPAIARHSDCQTCFQCEAYCPADAIFVSPSRTPEPQDSELRDEEHLIGQNLLGMYRERVGWRKSSPRPTQSTADYHQLAQNARRTP
ncbi:4Fe-4S dicluster domain-containing protein [Rhodococcus qingshengii]|jgi:NAD-dependent dihydropyrimidine dehydrogenase PreA subunit|uniref:4Fe-4S dicluster domain-containing protein n=1 Tax=Rhodococcus qingshengii TaxID=334542 RepID=UPI0001A217E5|nr:ferredoxin family protein [Rhodococcus qingshengii]EEN84224.1 4Fe-4S binding domain protein [Rhodococcus erythropolis SK121]QTS00411.1 ferredoxin family protein [Rhodococcus qingshengii]